MSIGRPTGSVRMITSEDFISVTGVNLDLVECLEITGEVGIIIPTHRIDVCLGDLSSKVGVGS